MGMLEALWDSLDFNRETDTLVFVGDYIDRGPDSKEVVDFVLDLQSTVKCVCLLGNHEQMLLTYHLYNSYKEFYLMNGGTSTVASYGLAQFRCREKDQYPARPPRLLPQPYPLLRNRGLHICARRA